MRFLLFFLSLFISVGLQAGIIKVINNSDQPIFVTAQKFGCLGICYTDHKGFDSLHNKTTLCCLEKEQGHTSKAASQFFLGVAGVFTVPGWYILPGQSEREDFSRNNYTFYAYQQDSNAQWINDKVDQGMTLNFPEDFNFIRK